MRKSILLTLGLAAACVLASCQGATKIKKEEFVAASEKLEAHTYSNATVKFDQKRVTLVGDFDTFQNDIAATREAETKSKVTLKLLPVEEKNFKYEEKCTYDAEGGKWNLDNPDGEAEALQILEQTMVYTIESTLPNIEESLNEEGVTGSLYFYKNPYKIEVKLDNTEEDEDGIRTTMKETETIQFDKYGFVTKISVSQSISYKIVDEVAFKTAMGVNDLGFEVDVSAYNKMYYKLNFTYTFSYK